MCQLEAGMPEEAAESLTKALDALAATSAFARSRLIISKRWESRSRRHPKSIRRRAEPARAGCRGAESAISCRTAHRTALEQPSRREQPTTRHRGIGQGEAVRDDAAVARHAGIQRRAGRTEAIDSGQRGRRRRDSSAADQRERGTQGIRTLPARRSG